MEKKPIYLETRITDLLDIIHLVIIKNMGENEIILSELKSIEEKMDNGQLPNYIVSENPFFQTIVNESIRNFLKEKGLKLM